MTDSSVETVARALRNHEDSYYDRVQGLHYFSERALAALPSPEREPMREALEKLAALRTMCEASNQPFYVEILDEIAAGIGLTWEALAPPTAQSGDRT